MGQCEARNMTVGGAGDPPPQLWSTRPRGGSRWRWPGCAVVEGLPPLSGDRQALHGLPGDLGDQVEVLVEMQDGQAAELRRRADDQVGYGGGPMLAPVDR